MSKKVVEGVFYVIKNGDRYKTHSRSRSMPALYKTPALARVNHKTGTMIKLDFNTMTMEITE